jgi:hypothetical protein
MLNGDDLNSFLTNAIDHKEREASEQTNLSTRNVGCPTFRRLGDSFNRLVKFVLKRGRKVLANRGIPASGFDCLVGSSRMELNHTHDVRPAYELEPHPTKQV